MKILILTASPERDSLIDLMLAECLIKKGCKVAISPCLRGGRQKILSLKPDIVVMPPIMNPYGRDMCGTIQSWKVPVAARFTEAGISHKRYNTMSMRKKVEVMGRWPHTADLVLVPSVESVEIHGRDGWGQSIKAVGSVMLDPYFMPDFNTRFMNREVFCKNCEISPDKKTILFASGWPFADTAPDLGVDEMRDYTMHSSECRTKWMEAITKVHGALGITHNIILKLHPSEPMSEYEKGMPDEVKILTHLPSPPVIKNIDILVHAGSTMAVEAHILNKPSFQFLRSTVGEDDLDIYNISPDCKTVEELIERLKIVPEKSNISSIALENLSGRYGIIDGKANERSAQFIENIISWRIPNGWPETKEGYEQPGVTKEPCQIRIDCGICRHSYFADRTKTDLFCPWCASRQFVDIKEVSKP